MIRSSGVLATGGAAATSDGAIRIVLNGRPLALASVSPTTTLLTWLRTDAALRGTKEGCAEGDCGACTVLIETADAGGMVTRRPVNACLMMMGQVDGLGIRTVEGLVGEDGHPHPVQEALASSGGTQCGFCTPGFVASAYAYAAAEDGKDHSAIHDALAGNLCRCTGYRPIVEAIAALSPLRADPLREYDAEVRTALEKVRRSATVEFTNGAQRFHSPRTMADLLALRAARPDAALLAGGTDLGLMASKAGGRLQEVIHLAHVPELTSVRHQDGDLLIGAAVEYGQLVALLVQSYPRLQAYLNRLGSRQIRTLGTLGGNLGTASPIGDALPLLLVLDARILLRSGARGGREVAADAFFLGWRRTLLEPDEVIEAVRLPLLPAGNVLFAEKVSKRRDQDISTVCAAYRLRMDANLVRNVRLAYGGMAAVPKRAVHAERCLEGQVFDSSAVEAAVSALQVDFAPLDDLRASARYRLEVAGNLLRRLHLHLTRPDLQLEVHAL